MHFKTKKQLFLCVFALIILGMKVGFTQQIVLLDRQLRKPFQLIDSLSLEPLQNGYFPILKKDLLKAIDLIEQSLQESVQKNNLQNASSHTIIGSTELITDSSASGKHRKRSMFLKTTIGFYSTYLYLTKATDSPVQSEHKLYQILDYLKNNVSVL